MPIKGDEVVTAEDPDFYIVDDKYSDECRLILEPLVEVLTLPWLKAVSESLSCFPGWDVLVHLNGGVDLVVSVGKVRVFGFSPAGGGAEVLLRELRNRMTN